MSNIAQLRSILKRLRAIEFDRTKPINHVLAPQQIMDFLAMVVGLKPVYVLGGEFDDPSWMEEVVKLAKVKKMFVIPGLEFNATPRIEEFPVWYVEFKQQVKPGIPVVYICKGPAVAEEVKAFCMTGEVSQETEARLSGRPLCCVRESYKRIATLELTGWRMLNRVANGDVEGIKRIIRENQMLAPNTEEDTVMKEAAKCVYAPYTSIEMCAACQSDTNSPARVLSREYEQLARNTHDFLVEYLRPDGDTGHTFH